MGGCKKLYRKTIHANAGSGWPMYGDVVFEGKTKGECMNYLNTLANPPEKIIVEDK